jgi:hypothetical protein
MVDLILPKGLPTTGSVPADAAFIMDTGSGVYQVTAAQIVAASPLPSLIYSTLGAFKAASIANKAQALQDPTIAFGQFNWETSGAPYTADNVNVIKADSTALSVGAWVRQAATAITSKQSGGGAIVRGLQAKLGDSLSVEDFGALPDQFAANFTTPWNLTVAALPTPGGVINTPSGNLYGNPEITQDCVIVYGNGGCVEYDAEAGFHGVFATGLRPKLTGAGTATLTVAAGAQHCRRVGLHDLSISGDDGTGGDTGEGDPPGNQAETTLLLGGGAIHTIVRGIGARDGIRTLALEPSNNLPVSCNFISDFDLRNYLDDPDARTVSLTRSDTAGLEGQYLTGCHFVNGHISGPRDGFAIEAIAPPTGGSCEIQMSMVYCDMRPGKGVSLIGSSVISAWDLTLDPGANGVVVIKTDQPVGSGDITSRIRGFIKHGGQKFEWVGGETIDIPDEVQFFFPGARLWHAYLSDLTYLTSAADPFNQTRFWDFQTNSGPYRLNGIDMRVMRTTEASDLSTAALQTEGGISAKKNVRVGNGLFVYGGGGASVFDVNANGAKVPTFTVAGLPSAATAGAGRMAYATNARNGGEGAASGTGSLVVSDGTNWKIPGIAGAVAA